RDAVPSSMSGVVAGLIMADSDGPVDELGGEPRRFGSESASGKLPTAGGPAEWVLCPGLQINLRSYANAVAAARDVTFVFTKIWLTWRSTVFSLNASSLAIALLVLPLAMSLSTCNSLPVSAGSAVP